MKKIICALIFVILITLPLCSCRVTESENTAAGTIALPENYSGEPVNLTLVAVNLSAQDEEIRTFEIESFRLKQGSRSKNFSFSADDIPFAEYILSYQLSGDNPMLLQTGYIDDEGKTVPSQCTAHIFGDAMTDIAVCPLVLTRCIGEISLPDGAGDTRAVVYAMVAGTEIDCCPVSVTEGRTALYEMYIPLEAAELYDISYVLEGKSSSLMPYGAFASVRPDNSQTPAVIPQICLPEKYTADMQLTADESFFADNEYITAELSVMSEGCVMSAVSSAIYPEEPVWQTEISLPSDRACELTVSVYAPESSNGSTLLRTFYVTSAGLNSMPDDALQISSKDDVPQSLSLVS